MKERVRFTVEVDVDVDLLAEQFAAMGDDAQAQFLCKAAERLRAAGDGAAERQGYFVGRHLATCDCSTDAGRELILAIHAGLTFRGK